MAHLESGEIERRLGELDGWTLADGAICKEFERGDFAGSVAFVNDLTPLAEEMNHHPDLAIAWDTVTVTLTTHSEGGLTEADFELAGKIDSLQ